MKGFCVALILLVALTLGVFFTARRVDGMLGALSETLIDEEITKASQLWEKHKLLLRLTLHQSEVAQIDERLAALKSAASLGNDFEVEMERARLLSLLRRARDTVSPSLTDIF